MILQWQRPSAKAHEEGARISRKCSSGARGKPLMFFWSKRKGCNVSQALHGEVCYMDFRAPPLQPEGSICIQPCHAIGRRQDVRESIHFKLLNMTYVICILTGAVPEYLILRIQ